MIDLSNKYISTESNLESENLLKMAISQGYKTAIGEHVLEDKRLFHFVGFPYKAVSTPNSISDVNKERVIRYCDLFGDEREELEKILDLTVRWCRAHGYGHVGIYANEEDDHFSGQALANSERGARQNVKLCFKKSQKVTLSDIENKFGYPIEIVQG